MMKKLTKPVVKKVIKSVLLLLPFLFFESWFYKIICLILMAVVWREELRAKHKWLFRGVLIALFVGLFWVLPRYRYNTSDRVRLIYQDENYNPVHPPVSHYLFNVFFPEEELCNFAIAGARCVPEEMPIAGWLVEEFKFEDERGNIRNFANCFRRMNWDGEFMMSGITSQMANMMGMEETRSVYLITPEDYDQSKTYPVVFFMHGFMGNWKLYTSILKEMDDRVVCCVGTRDWSGLFKNKDIGDLFEHQIPFIKKMGVNVDENNVHIIGLSNGGTAADVAYRDFSNKFKSITYLSTGINQTYRIPSKVLFIGGGKDHSSGSLPRAYKALKANGNPTDMYWKDDQTHFIFVNEADEIVDFLNRNID